MRVRVLLSGEYREVSQSDGEALIASGQAERAPHGHETDVVPPAVVPPVVAPLADVPVVHEIPPPHAPKLSTRRR